MDRSGNDFSKGSICRNIMSLALPMTLAQLINVLYSIVDRIYIGHIPNASTDALTGIGLSLPVITIISAFAYLFGMGGAPLCSIDRGARKFKRAEDIMGNVFVMLLISGAFMTVFFEIFQTPVLRQFGASEKTLPYASAYLSIYLLGTVFAMIGTGMNSFINAQGFGKTGMCTILLGALLNIVLDPLFIFTFGMGIRGAAIATVISQGASAAWVLIFLAGKTALLRLSFRTMKLSIPILKQIVSLGMSGFVMYLSTGIVQVACNSSLAKYGGDLCIGIMTVLTSIREIVYLPLSGLTGGAQPVIGYNYGAAEYGRVRKSISFMTFSCLIFSLAAWAVLLLFPRAILGIFSSDPDMLRSGVPAMYIYFFGLFMAAFQFSGQFTFVALGKPKQAIFFSTLRKVIIVVPLTIFLPMIPRLGADGVFLAEPISNFISGAACWLTMYLTILKKLPAGAKAAA